MKPPPLRPFNCRATGRFHLFASVGNWVTLARQLPVIGCSKSARNRRTFFFFSSNHHRSNAAMLFPHGIRLVYDGLSLFHERECLSMLKSLYGFPAVTGVKHTLVDVSADRPRHRRHIVRFRRTPVPKHRRRGVHWSSNASRTLGASPHPSLSPPTLYRRERVVLGVL